MKNINLPGMNATMDLIIHLIFIWTNLKCEHTPPLMYCMLNFWWRIHCQSIFSRISPVPVLAHPHPPPPIHVIPGSTYTKYSGVSEVDATVGGDSGAASGLPLSSFTCGEFLFVSLSFAAFLFAVVELGSSSLLLEYSTFRFFETVFA